MDGKETLFARLRADGEEKCLTLQVETEHQCQDLARTYEEQAAALRKALLAQWEERAQREGERQLRMARLAGRNRLLSLRQELVSAAFSRALERLLSLPEEGRIQLLAQLCIQAAETGREEVHLSPADRDSIGPAVLQQANALLALRQRREGSSNAPEAGLTLSEETRPISGGVILSADGVETNCSFDTLLRLQRQTMAAETARRLFSGH